MSALVLICYLVLPLVDILGAGVGGRRFVESLQSAAALMVFMPAGRSGKRTQLLFLGAGGGA